MNNEYSSFKKDNSVKYWRETVIRAEGLILIEASLFFFQPEGFVMIGQSNSNPCYDTRLLSGSDAGWANTYVPMHRLLSFMNKQIAAIKRADSKALVTIGSWNERTQTDQFGYRNHYKDA